MFRGEMGEVETRDLDTLPDSHFISKSQASYSANVVRPKYVIRTPCEVVLVFAS
jgi:hypothetical protein